MAEKKLKVKEPPAPTIESLQEEIKKLKKELNSCFRPGKRGFVTTVIGIYLGYSSVPEYNTMTVPQAYTEVILPKSNEFFESEFYTKLPDLKKENSVVLCDAITNFMISDGLLKGDDLYKMSIKSSMLKVIDKDISSLSVKEIAEALSKEAEELIDDEDEIKNIINSYLGKSSDEVDYDAVDDDDDDDD